MVNMQDPLQLVQTFVAMHMHVRGNGVAGDIYQLKGNA